jgi:hypothetical protein
LDTGHLCKKSSEAGFRYSIHVAPGAAQEMPNEGAAIRKAEAMSRDAAHAGALAFKRSGDPKVGSFADATILRTFGEVPAHLDEL